MPVGRKRVHGEATAAALLDAAEAIVESEGVEALTVRRVADEVGTTTRAVYSTLGSKEALLSGLGERAFEMLGAAVAALPHSDDPAADLVAAGMVFRRFALTHPALFRVGFRVQDSVPQEVAARFRPSAARALGGLHELIRRVDDGGGLGGRTQDDATWQFDALCEGLAIGDLRCGTPHTNTASKATWADALGALVAGWRLTSPTRNRRRPTRIRQPA